MQLHGFGNPRGLGFSEGGTYRRCLANILFHNGRQIDRGRSAGRKTGPAKGPSIGSQSSRLLILVSR